MKYIGCRNNVSAILDEVIRTRAVSELVVDRRIRQDHATREGRTAVWAC